MEWKRTVSGLAAVFQEAGRLAESAGLGAAAAWSESAARRFVEARPALTDLGDELAAGLLKGKDHAPLVPDPESLPAVERAIAAVDAVSGDPGLAIVESVLAAWESAVGPRACTMRFEAALADVRSRGANNAVLVGIVLDGLVAHALAEACSLPPRSAPIRPTEEALLHAAGVCLLATDRLAAALDGLLRATSSPRHAVLGVGAERAWVLLPDDGETGSALDGFRERLEHETLLADAGAVQPFLAVASFPTEAPADVRSVLKQLSLDLDARRRTAFVNALGEAGVLGPYGSPRSDAERARDADQLRTRWTDRATGLSISAWAGPQLVAVIGKVGEPGPTDPPGWDAWMEGLSFAAAQAGSPDPGAVQVDLRDHRVLFGGAREVVQTATSLVDTGTRAAILRVVDNSDSDPASDPDSDLDRAWASAVSAAWATCASTEAGRISFLGTSLTDAEFRHAIQDGGALVALAGRAPGAASALTQASARIRDGSTGLSAITRLSGRIHELVAQVRSSDDSSDGGATDKGVRILMRGFPAGFESGVAHVALSYAVMVARAARSPDEGCPSLDPTELDAMEIRS